MREHSKMRKCRKQAEQQDSASEMKKPRQIVMHCPCGNAKVLAKGLCSTCYTLKRQDEEYFRRTSRGSAEAGRLPMPRSWMSDGQAWKAVRGSTSPGVGQQRSSEDAYPVLGLSREGYSNVLRAGRLARVSASPLERTTSRRPRATRPKLLRENALRQRTCRYLVTFRKLHGGSIPEMRK